MFVWSFDFLGVRIFMLLFLDFVYVVFFFFFFLFGPNTLSLSDPISDALSDPIYDPISWQSGTRKWVQRHPWVGLATLLAPPSNSEAALEFFSDCQNRLYLGSLLEAFPGSGGPLGRS